MEDDDLAALRLGAEPRGELVHQDPVAGHDRVLHRLRGDEERLDHEGLDAEGEKQRDAEQDRDLAPKPDRLEPASPPLRHADPPVASHRAVRSVASLGGYRFHLKKGEHPRSRGYRGWL